MNLLYLFQKPTQTNSDYHEDFTTMVEVIEKYGWAGLLIYLPNMIKKELMAKSIDTDKATGDEMKEAKKTVREKFLATLMLNGANCDKYGELKRSMAENYVMGTSEYPEAPNLSYVSWTRTSHRWDWTGTSNRMPEIYQMKGRCLPSQVETTCGRRT